MTIITIEEARHHLRVEPDYPQEQVLPYLEGAEALAQQFLNRRVFASQAELDGARQAMPAALEAAALARDQAIANAAELTDCAARDMLKALANDAYSAVLAEQRRIALGMVITPNVKSAVLLTLGHLYDNRETVVVGTISTDLDMGAYTLLWPSRVGLGV